ncbi:MAG TPA: LacI family DNA-binding transcriptional regulator [Qipengyuania sp.]|nr:LacI family DNA-binding transcriptional regulator [Qipengyuania sp.]
MVTIREVARAAGVSVATASRALNGLTSVTPQTRARIESAAAELDYVPHSGARSLTRRRTDTVGVILPDLYGEFFSEIIRGIDQVVHGASKHLLLANMHGDAEETALAIRALRGRVDGLLVMPPDSNAETIAGRLGGGTPTVLLGARPKDEATPFVAVDNYAGARLVTGHLVERGARRLVHIAGPTHNHDARERERAFRDVVRERLGITDPVVIAGDFREEGGRAAAHQVLRGQSTCDAVFAANDLMAVEFMSAMREAGVPVGTDLMVAGFDDIPLARYVMPQLTTVHSDILRLGQAAAELVLRLLDGGAEAGPTGLVISPTLAIRGSSAGRG